MLSLSGKIAVVTGAGTGIGRGIALELGRQGAAVVVHFCRSAAGAESAVQEIAAAGGRALALRADLSRVAECRRLIEECVAQWGGIDILVNNAAVSTERPLLEVTEEMWDQTLDTNLKGAFFCTQAAARQMVRQGRGGKVVHIGSTHGVLSAPGFAAYGAAKGGLHLLTGQMASELAPYHINVNCVAPGMVEVERYFTQFPDYDPQVSARNIPWKRVGRPADIAGFVAFLCSDAADFMTGQVVVVDGGQLAAQPLVRSDIA